MFNRVSTIRISIELMSAGIAIDLSH